MPASQNAGFSGIYAILYAFFDARGRLDRDLMRRQTEASISTGIHGIAALGLATEVSKLSPAERADVMRWLVEDAAGRLPVAITVFGNDSATQITACRAAAGCGVDWLILQPPQSGPMPEHDLVEFLSAVMAACPLPVAIQNAPQYLGNGLSDGGLRVLADRHPNFRLLKGEGTALQVGETIQALDGLLAVFNGRGGLELTDNLRAGCAGMIIAPECAEMQVRIYDALQRGDEAEAERLYAQILPLVTFLMQSIDQFICYGKRMVARRMGVAEVHDRAPAQAPTKFGLASLARYGDFLGSYRI